MTKVATERLESDTLKAIAALAPFAAGDIIKATGGTTFEKVPLGTGGGIQLGTVISLSGPAGNIPGIPSGVKRVTLHLINVSTSGTSPVIVQLGDSGGIETSDYNAVLNVLTASSAVAVNSSAAGFQLPALDAAVERSGNLVFSLYNATNLWVVSGSIACRGSAIGGTIAGYKSLSGVLDRLRITAANGTDTFDNGSINVSWEF